MFPGEYRKIRFEFSGISVQAILDKIPTTKVIDKVGDIKIIEAETFGTGINMFLLSQGCRVNLTKRSVDIRRITAYNGNICLYTHLPLWREQKMNVLPQENT